MNTWPFGSLHPFRYGLIVIDPPWRFETYSAAGRGEKSPDAQYATMTMDDILNLPVGDLAAPDAVLWAWATHPMIDQQIAAVRRWGFKFVTSGVWVKRTKNGKLAFGTGYRLRCASEPFIIATIGNPKTAKNVRTVIEGPIREHSRKPEEAYAEAERMVPGVDRADVFSRTTRPGWDAFGFETGKFDER